MESQQTAYVPLLGIDEIGVAKLGAASVNAESDCFQRNSIPHSMRLCLTPATQKQVQLNER